MRQRLNQGLASLHGLCTLLLSEKGRLSAPSWKVSPHSPLGNDSWQKAASGPYLRHFDAYHRLNLAICRSGRARIRLFSAKSKNGEFLSQSVFRAKLCAWKISIDSPIQAQESGEFMRRKWRGYGNSYTLPAEHSSVCASSRF
jgi:hypothetical protein